MSNVSSATNSHNSDNYNSDNSTPSLILPRHADTRLESDWLFLLQDLPHNQWYSSDYAYKTSGWLNVHTKIRKRQRILRELGEEYLMGALNWDNYRSQILQRINQHVYKLHQHHSVEDAGFFPEFVSTYPQLKRGFEILEGDHVRLDKLLEELQTLNDQLLTADVEDKFLAEKLQNKLVEASDLLSQHLTDEEDLVIPILGLRQS